MRTVLLCCEGPPQPGDCWTGHTPDIRPGDKIRVTHGTARNSVLVDDITFSGPAFFEENPVAGENHNILVKGVAKRANGTAIPISLLDSSEFRDTSKFRGAPNRAAQAVPAEQRRTCSRLRTRRPATWFAPTRSGLRAHCAGHRWSRMSNRAQSR